MQLEQQAAMAGAVAAGEAEQSACRNCRWIAQIAWHEVTGRFATHALQQCFRPPLRGARRQRTHAPLPARRQPRMTAAGHAGSVRRAVPQEAQIVRAVGGRQCPGLRLGDGFGVHRAARRGPQGAAIRGAQCACILVLVPGAGAAGLPVAAAGEEFDGRLETAETQASATREEARALKRQLRELTGQISPWGKGPGEVDRGACLKSLDQITHCQQPAMELA